MVRDLEALSAGRHALAARRMPDGGGAQGGARRSATSKRSPSGPTDARAVHPLPDAAARRRGKIVGAINMLVDISERRQAETQQRMLLRELNHRVKNNMQMLQSLLYAAAKKTRNADAADILDKASKRITAMAAAQRVLYATDATSFQAGEFLDAVCQSAQQTLPPNVKIVRAPASGELSNDAAMPLALILNELLTNAAKYGVNGSGDCVIRVGLTKGGRLFCPLCGRRRSGVRSEYRRTPVVGSRAGPGSGRTTARTIRGDEKPGHPLHAALRLERDPIQLNRITVSWFASSMILAETGSHSGSSPGQAFSGSCSQRSISCR